MGVPIKMILVFGVLSWGPLSDGNYHILSLEGLSQYLIRAALPRIRVKIGANCKSPFNV